METNIVLLALIGISVVGVAGVIYAAIMSGNAGNS